jgi:hypothetical protein
MTKEKKRDLFLNWKGLEFMHSLKSISKVLMIILSFIFIFISLSIQNYYVLGISLIILFLQILSENNKEYFLKYKEIFEEINDDKSYKKYKEWINFLEKTKGLNSIYKWIIGLFLNRKFEELNKFDGKEKNKSKRI